jgi:cellulose synthase/poly-beta-1,6-N-acetylglucosamine synthase-like glycosyltransferase
MDNRLVHLPAGDVHRVSTPIHPLHPSPTLTIYSINRFSRAPRIAPPTPPPDSLPGVTIIRPLRGLDPNLYYNLESTLALDYPRDRYEVIFALQRENDQALDVVRRLMDKYAEVDMRVVVCESSFHKVSVEGDG